MIHPSFKLRMFQDYHERVNALMVDGYKKRHETITNTFACCRLHHMSNGNDIVITMSGSRLVQKTNHVVTFAQDYDSNTQVH